MSLLTGLLEVDLTNPLPFADTNLSRRDVRIAIRSDSANGAGTVDNAYDGSTGSKLDSVLNDATKITGNMTIRFGPGVFQTRGFGAVVPGFAVRAGQRFVGAGIYQTTLQLVQASPPLDQVAAVAVFGSALAVADLFISDMTLDCNAARQPLDANGKPALLSLTGVRLEAGSRVHLKRVRIINWGTHAPFISGQPTKTKECFPIFIVSGPNGAVGEAIVEDCIIEQPDFSQARETTMLLNRAESSSPGILATIRNNYLNGDFTTGLPPLAVPAASFVETDSGTKLTLRTRWPHRVEAGDELLVAGSPAAALNRRYDAANDHLQIVDDYTLKFDKPSYSESAFGPDLVARRYVPKAMTVASLSRNGTTGTTATLITSEPHLRKAGDVIRVSGARIAGSPGDPCNNVFNGAFKVVSVSGTNPNELTYTIASDATPGTTPDAGSEMWLDRWPSQSVVIANGGLTLLTGNYAKVQTAAPHYRAPGDYVLIAEAGTGWSGYFKVEEDWSLQNNKQFKCKLDTTPGTATYGTAVIPQTFQGTTAITGIGPIVRANRKVGLRVGGPYHDLGPPNSPKSRDMIIWDNYYFFVLTGPYSNIADGYANGGNTDNRERFTYVERNIVDLQPRAAGSENQPASVAFAYAGPYDPNSTHYPSFLGLVLRKNVVRTADGAVDPGGYQHTESGINVWSSQRLVMQNNLVDLPLSIIPIRFYWGQDFESFNNAQTDGKLVLPINQVDSTLLGPKSYHLDDLQTIADDLFWVWSKRPEFP